MHPAFSNQTLPLVPPSDCHQDCQSKVRDIDEQQRALEKDVAALNLRDNELLAEKKRLCELKGKKRQLEQKISTKQDR